MWHLIPPHCRQHLKLRISHPKIVWWLWSLNFESVFFVEFRSAELWTKSWRCRQNMPIWTKFIDSQFLFCMTKELPSHGGLRKDEFQWNSHRGAGYAICFERLPGVAGQLTQVQRGCWEIAFPGRECFEMATSCPGICTEIQEVVSRISWLSWSGGLFKKK